MTTKNDLSFTFQSTVEFDSTVADGYMKHYVPIPPEIGAQFENADIRHIQGSLNGEAFRRVLNVRDDKTYYLNFGMTWLKQAQLTVDMDITVQLEPDPDPDMVDLPEELIAELQIEPDIMEVWSQLSTSRQKTYAYGVNRAKKSETRQRRSRKIVEELREMLLE